MDHGARENIQVLKTNYQIKIVLMRIFVTEQLMTSWKKLRQT